MKMSRLLGVVVVLALTTCCSGEIRQSVIEADLRPYIEFERFGFDRLGVLNISVTDMKVYSPDNIDPDLGSLGFFLTTDEDLLTVEADSEETKPTCILSLVNTLFLLSDVNTWPKDNPSMSFKTGSPNEYILFFANCLKNTAVSMKVKTTMYNLDEKSHVPDYLPAGQTQLPKLFFSLSLAFLGLGVIWIYVCVKQKDSCHRIHILMGILVFLKALNLMAEAADKSYVKKTGTPHGWDIAFYIFGFLRGVMLFVVIVLIGTGWSFLKPYLQEKEKKILMVVIPLQVFSNVANIVIDETGPSAKDWFAWKQVFLFLDIICCCAVLFPIVWSIKHLREASRTDGKAARNVVKLTLFRHYYIVVVSFIYFTRIVVFALTTVTAYRYRWTSYLAQELASLAFYIFTGYKFRPVVHNPYFVLEEEEEEMPSEDALKDDEFDL